jgi:signal transduction histidine kinase/CheY-like chemotaxis protein/HPt (histidine-containing phosphotransfer) domain-containing protein
MAIKTTSLHKWDIKTLVEGISQPNIKAVVYFFSPSFEDQQIQRAINEAFPGAECIGASMFGGWSSNGAIRNGITAMSLSSDEVSEVYVTFQQNVKKEPVMAARDAIADLKWQAAREKINPDEFLGLIFFDGLCLGELIMKEFSMEQNLNMAFIGGAAADEMTFTKTLVAAGSQISSDGLVAVILKMKIPFFFDHYVHYLPTATSFVITRVEIMRRIAWEINGEPAAEFYARRVGVGDVSNLTVEVFARNPIGLILGDSIYIRSPNRVVDGNGLQFYCYIEAGTRVFLLQQGNIIAHAESSLAAVEQFLPGIQGCLLFNCIQRYLELFEKEKIDTFNNVFNKYPMIGFNTYGEELFTHHNQTLTAVFFGQRPEAGMTDPYKAKRLFHYTDSKLKSLVFDIVSRSELLNITISYLKGSMDAESDETALKNYQNIRNSLDTMIEQSNISKEDIERMLVVYQNNVQKTGEYVFNIVDEINIQNRRLADLREESEMANRTKTSFLASMSHEIRTPMNAITGMTELLLRSGLSNEAKGYVQDIKKAGNNLISIINDILDFSKVEAGKMEIIPVKYQLSSLIHDTVNIIRMRIMEKSIRFYTNIDGKIPNNLIGDEVRLRQILLNLLSNAAKFTDKGHISLTILQESKTNDHVVLRFIVTDTGKGISPEDQKKLFGEFVQVDLKRNRGMEGTGLGLAITRKLCAVMGGEIKVESEYGKGSTFSAVIPQGVDSSEPFASVDDAESKKVLIYERRLVYSQSACWSLDNMGVKYTMVPTMEEFSEALFREEWSLVLSSYGLHDKIRQVMERPAAVYPGGKVPQLALMVEWGTEVYISNVRLMSLPVQTLSIANILNGKADSEDYHESFNKVQHTYPNAKILVVDDIPTNLKVTEGLVAPYEIGVDTCLSGQEAIELVKRNRYDVVFMDHMMPEMDGIEATSIIREWERENMPGYNIPIIALTANAVSGVKEMFMESGFNDFLAKPIEVTKLDEILAMWIPNEKREKGSRSKDTVAKPSLTIPGLDIAKGIQMTGGTESGYRSVLSIFKTDVENRMGMLRSMPTTDSLHDFVINVHALKSASLSIGGVEISAEAARLEAAGKSKDYGYIQENLKKFAGRIEKLADDIGNVLELNKESGGEDKKKRGAELIIPILRELEAALETENISHIDRILKTLNEKTLDQKTKEALEQLSDDVLLTEFARAKETCRKLISGE